MKFVNLSENNSVLNTFVAEMRDRNVQGDSLRFRENLKRLGQIFAYEISKTLNYSDKQIQTPLATATVSTADDNLVIGTILRAGLPLHEGLLSFFDKAQNAFVAAFRKYDSADKFHIDTHYCACPGLEGKTLILADTMLATGSSLLIALERMIAEGGQPDCIHLVCPIASEYAVEVLKKHCGENVTLWTAAVDPELTSHSYIVPGLGDAGDLAYGEKN